MKPKTIIVNILVLLIRSGLVMSMSLSLAMISKLDKEEIRQQLGKQQKNSH